MRAQTRAGQLRAETGMVDQCRIDRVVGVGVDDATASPTAILLDPPVFVGLAKVQSYRPFEQTRDVAGAMTTTQRYDLDIPAVERMPELVAAGSPTASVWNGPIREGDYATVTTHGIERVFRIGAPHHKTFQTSQRLLVDEVLSGIPPEV